MDTFGNPHRTKRHNEAFVGHIVRQSMRCHEVSRMVLHRQVVFFCWFFSFFFFLRAHVGKVNISLKGLQFENLSEHLLPLEELGERKFSK